VDIVPLEGLESIRFGDSSADVHRMLGDPWRRIDDTEQYQEGWLLDFDPEDRLDFIQTWGSGQLTLGGVPLVGAPAAEVVRALRAAGSEPEREDDGRLYAHALGIGFMGDPVESVWIYPPGYYD
jgi:hypothetical protein